MQPLIAILSARLLAVVGWGGDSCPEISIAELKTAIAEKKAVVIDVNGSSPPRRGPMPGAIDSSTHQGSLAGKLSADKQALIVADCKNPH